MADSNNSRGLSRREMFARLFKPVRAAAAAFPNPAVPAPPPRSVPAANPFDLSAKSSSVPVTPVTPTADLNRVAVIAGRHCLAYQGTGCSVCHDRCPVAGAIVLEQGLPRVEPAVCIGCNVCHDVCPAPENAVRVVPRPPGMPRPSSAVPPPASSPFPSLEPRPDVDDV